MQTIDNARSIVLVQAYSFTSEPIAEALVRAHGRGVEVQAILDGSQRTQKYTAAKLLIRAGIPVLKCFASRPLTGFIQLCRLICGEIPAVIVDGVESLAIWIDSDPVQPLIIAAIVMS